MARPSSWQKFVRIGSLLAGLLALAFAMAKSTDYYSIFDLTKETFDKTKLRKAYYKLAKMYHPDKNPDDPDAHTKLTEVTKAFDVLNDDEKRPIYDKYGEEGLESGAGGHGGFGHGGFDPRDIFEQFFGAGSFGNRGRGGHSQRPRGHDSRVELKVTLEDMYKGATHKIEVNRQKICPACKGVGAKNAQDVAVCADCRGTGAKIYHRMIAMGIVQQIQTTCDKCGGRGKTFKSVCAKCTGQKIVRGDDVVSVVIDPGMPNGHHIPFRGMSDEHPDYDAGDLYVTLVTEPHAVFHREGLQLYMEQPISLREALLGFSKTVKHLDGHVVKLVRTAVTQPGFVQMIPNEGMPQQDDDEKRGDLYVTYRVALPVTLTKKQKDVFAAHLSDHKNDGHDEL